MNYKTAKGWLSENERQFLFDIAKKSATIINVGIEYGASLHCLRQGNASANIVAIDLIGSEKLEGISDLGYTQLLTVESSNNAKTNKLDVKATVSQSSFLLLIKADSTKLELKNFSADSTFIDGGHDYRCVKNDIARYAPITKKYLMFHDYSNAEIHDGVKKALDEWQSPDFELYKQIDTIRAYKRILPAS